MQNNNFNNNFQNNGFYPNNFNNQQYAPVDAGEKDASTAQLCGILSLFLGPVLAIISLVFASKYKKTGNGQNTKKVKTGKICSWISIISYILAIVLFASTFFTVFGGFSSSLDNDYVYSDEINADEILFEKDIPEEGIVIYDEGAIKATLYGLYLTSNSNYDKPTIKAVYKIDIPSGYNLVFDKVTVNGNPSESHSIITLGDRPTTLTFTASNVNSIEDIEDIACQYSLKEGSIKLKTIVLDLSFD